MICIFLGCVFAYLILISVIGPERLGRRFDTEEASDVVDVLAVPEGLGLEKANVKHQEWRISCCN